MIPDAHHQGRPWPAAELRRLEILSSRLVTSIFAGEYRSVFRGRGIEFEEVREYQPGDDIRGIDWNVTARAGRPFVKQYVEEREMTVMLLLDQSASMKRDTPRQAKDRVAAEICALLAFAAARSNDRIGLLTFTDRIEHYLAPAKGPPPRPRATPGGSSPRCCAPRLPAGARTWPAPWIIWKGSCGAAVSCSWSRISSPPIFVCRSPRPPGGTMWSPFP